MSGTAMAARAHWFMLPPRIDPLPAVAGTAGGCRTPPVLGGDLTRKGVSRRPTRLRSHQLTTRRVQRVGPVSDHASSTAGDPRHDGRTRGFRRAGDQENPYVACGAAVHPLLCVMPADAVVWVGTGQVMRHSPVRDDPPGSAAWSGLAEGLHLGRGRLLTGWRRDPRRDAIIPFG